jgi:hypothetical protein
VVWLATGTSVLPWTLINLRHFPRICMVQVHGAALHAKVHLDPFENVWCLEVVSVPADMA